jgi:hypothetical protein
MAAGGRDFESPFGALLTPDVAEVGLRPGGRGAYGDRR